MNTDKNGMYVVIEGERWYKYFIQYRCDNGSWSCDIWARDEAEAKRHLLAIGGNGEINGPVHGSFAAGPGVGLYVRAQVWFRNLLSGWRG